MLPDSQAGSWAAYAAKLIGKAGQVKYPRDMFQVIFQEMVENQE